MPIKSKFHEGKLETGQIVLEVSKPDAGAFVKFDSEGQSEIRIVVDASQKESVRQLIDFPYGQTFSLIVSR